MTDVRTKSLAYLRDGKVTIGSARLPRIADPDRPEFVQARVVGHQATYRVHLLDGVWSCSCASVWSDCEPCAHLAAVQLVTGHPSAAARSVRAAS